MANNEEEKIKYKAMCFRLSEETRQNLKEQRAKSGKTWNMFMVELLKRKKA